MDSPKETSPEQDLELLRSSAVAAGILATAYFRRDVNVSYKDNSSPVTEADLMVDRFLKQTLIASRPSYGWLSEETPDDLDRLQKRRTFVVDPIDGTRAFIAGQDNWTVCLAVVENGVPIAGVVYAPARDEMYDAALGQGARLNGKPLVRQSDSRRLIPAPGAVHAELASAGLAYERGPYYSSLAYRLCRLATGKFEAVMVRRGASDWDIAAAAIVLSESGLIFDDVCAERIVFNKAEVRHGALAAFADPSLKSVLHAALIRVYGCPSEEAATDLLEQRHP